MTDTPEPDQPAEPEERRCAKCGGPYDHPPADSHIPVCVQCLRDQSWVRARSNEVRSSDGEMEGEADPTKIAAFLTSDRTPS